MAWLVLTLLAAILEVIAVQKNNKKLELMAKPAVMIFLFIWLLNSTGLQGNALWFGLGLVFSLLGDLLLIHSSERMFMLGLSAFLLTHIFYIMGFQDELLNFTAWSFILIFIIYSNGIRILRRIVGAMRAQGQNTSVMPVIVYGLVLSLMLFAAMSTIFNPAWKTSASFFVSVGAFLFLLSDLVLAWNKFVSPITNGHILNIVAYYLGQIGLIAGVIVQSITLQG